MEAKQDANAVSGRLPSHARVVIIGGGVIGCSTAYHLAKLGWKDVVILERKQLTSGTTWHAAGLVVCGGFQTETLLTLAHYTRELYKNLEKETGVSTGFKAVGYIQAASSASRMPSSRCGPPSCTNSCRVRPRAPLPAASRLTRRRKATACSRQPSHPSATRPHFG